MSRTTWLIVAAVFFLLSPIILLASCLGVATLDESARAQSCNSGVPASVVNLTVKGRPATPEQVKVARIIIAIGHSRGFSQRDILVALMVGIQESSLTNLLYGDGDSLGVFQQTHYYGSPENRTNVIKATQMFYDHMKNVSGRQKMSLLEIALATQNPLRSAYLNPGNYFPSWQPEAERLLGTYVSFNTECKIDNTGVTGKVIIADGANLPGQPIASETMAFLAKVSGIYGKPLVVTTGTNHSYFTIDGKVSDHATGHAADIGMVANGGYDDSPVGDKIATACLIAAGDSPSTAASEARAGGLFSRFKDGLNIQCIWKTYSGGDHHNHVHIGANPG